MNEYTVLTYIASVVGMIIILFFTLIYIPERLQESNERKTNDRKICK